MIELNGIAKTYTDANGRPKPALLPTDLSIANGSFVALVGPSGCGKTTLLKMIAGLVPISEGSMTLDGDESSIPTDRMGIVFQQPALLPWRKVLKNLLLPAEIMGKDTRQSLARARSLLKRVGLEGTEDQLPDELSGGMQQRVAIARALVEDPDILLMDEPFSALDAITRDDLGEMLQSLLMQAERTVIFVTHNISEAAFLADRIVVLSSRPGRVAANIEVEIARPRDKSNPDTATALARIEAEVRAAMDAGSETQLDFEETSVK